MQLLIGFSLGILVSLVAWRLRSLSNSGAFAAAVTGGLIFGLGGWPWAAVLLTFFISSSALSKIFKRQKKDLGEKFSKGSQRDWGQVLANGGLGTLFVLLWAFYPDQTWLWAAYAGALATVNADTWATEIGVLNPKPPRLITNWKIVEPGTSGGISLLGTLATIGGAVTVGLVGVLVSISGGARLIWLAAPLGGVTGAFCDSFLGATVQAIYHCPHCDKETEHHPIHSCGTETGHTRGWKWLSNDLVNFLASVVGAVVAVIIFV
jgi:uncharacterized protein (TIGR00297 family)